MFALEVEVRTFPLGEWPREHEATSVIEISDGETALRLPTPFSLTERPQWDLEDVVMKPGEWTRFAPLVPISDHLRAHARISADAEQNAFLETALDEGELQIRLPPDQEEGPLTLAVGYSADTEGPCEGTRECYASLGGQVILDVEVVAP